MMAHQDHRSMDNQPRTPRRPVVNRMAINVILNEEDDHKNYHENSPLEKIDQTCYPVALIESRHGYDAPDAYRPATSSTNTSVHSYSPPTSITRTTRLPRKKYNPEEAYFIWYHRTDLGLPWDRVEQEYARWWKQDRRKSGLQCKFYRLLEDWGVEKVRDQTRYNQGKADKVGQFGLVQRTHLRSFTWMQPHHRRQPQLPQFHGTRLQRDKGSPFYGCGNCRL